MHISLYKINTYAVLEKNVLPKKGKLNKEGFEREARITPRITTQRKQIHTTRRTWNNYTIIQKQK